MTDLQVISEPAAAVAALDPMRRDILAALAEPGSATSVAAALRLPRQKVNYHLRTLEAHGLVHEVGTRQRRGLRERLGQASATAYLVGPDALGDLAADPARTDRLSSRYLIALAARLVREVGQLASLADAAGKPLASLAIDTEIRFASASDRAAFTADLRDAVLALSARYHDERAPDGRTHRLVIAAHPTLPPQTTTKEPT